VDAASALVEDRVPPPSQAQRKQALRLAAQELASLGITGVHDAGVDSLTLSAYKELAAGEGMAVRVYAMLSGDEYGQLEPPPPLSVNDELLVVRSIKLYADGAMGSRGAAFLEPYQDDPGNKGLLFLEQEQLDALVQKWSRAGYQVNVHAIGDRAIQVVLNAFETLDAGERAQRRHRVEHAQVGTVKDLRRFAPLGIIPSMQPTHATSDWSMVMERLDEDRTAGAYAWRTLLDDGNRIAAGSDFPVESADPLLGLYAGVTRIDLQGKPPGGWMPEQRMTLEEVLRAFTLDAAYAAHQENSLGSLEKGKSADFILLDRDLFSGDAEDIKDARILGTWLAGRQTYSVEGR
jgi:predicted amidohydrolase YtcJ